MDEQTRSRIGWLVLRLALAVLIGDHGFYLLYTGGSTVFGQWLTSQGVPFGTAVAWAITMFEVSSSILLSINRFVLPISLGLSAIYAMGIAMVHAPEGWFV